MLKRPYQTSPVKSPSRTSAAAAAPATPNPSATQARTRYLYAVIASIPEYTAERDDLWHIMTTVPTNLDVQFEILKDELTNAKNKLGLIREYPGSAFFNIVTKEDIKTILLRGSGIYGALIERGDPTKLAVHTRHAAHTNIHEKHTACDINGVSHEEKVDVTIRGSINNVLKDLISIQTLLTNKIKYNKDKTQDLQQELKPLISILAEFVRYLSAHLKCVEIASRFDFVNKALLNESLVPRQVNPWLTAWHPAAMKQVTPNQCTPGMLAFSEHYKTHYGFRSHAAGPPVSPQPPAANASQSSAAGRATKTPRLTPQANVVAATQVTPTRLPAAARQLFLTPGLSTAFASLPATLAGPNATTSTPTFRKIL